MREIREFGKEYWRIVITRFLCAGLLLSLLMMVALPAYASTWVNYFPISITDTSGTARTNIPILTGVTGEALNSGGFINSSGTNTNAQLGSSNVTYMMGSTNVNMVLASLPAYATETIELYTGYSPVQTSFPIITGSNGSITTTNSTSLNVSNSGNYTFSGLFDAASTGYLLNSTPSMTVKGNGIGNVYASTISSAGVGFPSIVTTNNGSASTINVVVNLPASYVRDDLLMIFLSTQSGAANHTISTPSGWTSLYSNPVFIGTAYRCNSVFYKVSAGTEGSSVAFTENATTCSYSSLRIGWGTYWGIPVIGIPATGVGGNPNPPTLTSGFGAVDTLWLASCFSLASPGTAPANYTTISSSSNTSCFNTVTYRNYTIATDDPGTFGTSTSWIANTIAIRGAVSVSSSAISSGVHTIGVSWLTNYLSNTSFETGGSDNTSPTGWTSAGGAGSVIGKSSTRAYFDTYSCNITSTGAYGNAAVNFGTTLNGQTVTLGAWVWASVANYADIVLNTDGVNTRSSKHTGDSTWQFLTVTVAITGGSAACTAYMNAEAGSSSTAYFDGAILVVGSSTSYLPSNYYNFNIWSDGVNVGSAAVDGAVTIPTSTSSLTWLTSNIMPYCNSISVYKSGTQTLLYQPAVMITGTTIIDASGNSNTGTITWGSNSGVTISFGAVVSSAATSSNISYASGNFSPPNLSISSSWYGTGNVSDAQFWSIFSGMSTSAGFDGKTILMFVAIGVAMIFGMLVFRSSGSVLISTILIGGVLYFFSEMSIIPFALVFIFLLISAGIMYLVRLI